MDYTDRDRQLLREIRIAEDNNDIELARKLKRRLDANRNRRERDDVMRSVGLVKCRDSSGRTIWE